MWLVILMFSGALSSIIIREFDELLASAVILSSFIPLLMGTGGNAASQASTLIIRGMALGEISEKQIKTVLYKELRVGIITGLVLGVTNFLRLFIFETNLPLNINLIVSISIVFVVVFAKLIGCILPIVAKTLKLDPAIMAGPLISTMLDSLALLIYFKLAEILITL